MSADIENINIIMDIKLKAEINKKLGRFNLEDDIKIND